jgi:hypothetical protein
VRVGTYRRTRNTGSLRLIGAVICVLASVAIFAHHGVPAMDMHGMASATETCVAVAVHATDAPAAPGVNLAALAEVLLLIPLALGLASARATGRARAGPRELRIPLRC